MKHIRAVQPLDVTVTTKGGLSHPKSSSKKITNRIDIFQEGSTLKRRKVNEMRENMKVIVVPKESAPFLYTMPEYESILLYQDDKGNVQVLDVYIHFIENADKNVSTIITASGEMITNTVLKRLITECDYPV